VESRVDRGTSSLPRQFVDEFCRQYGVSGGYVSTSALTGEGTLELLNRLRRRWLGTRCLPRSLRSFQVHQGYSP
jgi:hypothetical protein